MKLKIASCCNEAKYKSCYVIYVNTMIGDGDGYRKIALKFEDEAKCLAVAEFLSTKPIFDDEDWDVVRKRYPVIDANFPEDFGPHDWPSDPSSGMLFEPWVFNIKFYNHYGLEYDVTLVEDSKPKKKEEVSA